MVRKATVKTNQLPLPGVHVVTISDIKQVENDPTKFMVTLELVDPEPEATKFCIFHKPTKTYTVLGATNIHHASNKATKLYGHEWTGISRDVPNNAVHWKFLGVKKFGELIKKAL